MSQRPGYGPIVWAASCMEERPCGETSCGRCDLGQFFGVLWTEEFLPAICCLCWPLTPALMLPLVLPSARALMRCFDALREDEERLSIASCTPGCFSFKATQCAGD